MISTSASRFSSSRDPFRKRLTSPIIWYELISDGLAGFERALNEECADERTRMINVNSEEVISIQLYHRIRCTMIMNVLSSSSCHFPR